MTAERMTEMVCGHVRQKDHEKGLQFDYSGAPAVCKKVAAGATRLCMAADIAKREDRL